MTKTDTYEIRDDRFKRSIKLDEPIDQIWTGGKWTEGPVYSPTFRCLIWSDIPNDRRLRWDELTGAIGDIRSGLGYYTNGSTLDRQGRIVACEHGTRSVTRIEHDGSVTTLASHFEGKRFNSPNDVVVRSDDTIWFSDPAYGIESDYEGFQADPELDGEHVYRLDPATGDVTQVTTDFACPNGLAFSLDEQTLYIADSGGTRYASGEHHIRAFSVSADGKLSGGDVFAECEEGVFDGFRLDTQGRIWTSAKDGVHCYHPDGTLLGKVFVPEEVSNVCFGGPKRNRLFITASTSVYAVLLPTTGAMLF
ncbi:SMP-30/gluconolactonase/LRE family protein [Ruegeria sp. R13_0]|uniref:SMP-30/gluconolactonase/LRE family protein n=1 Tax=Ruegeria sp. R13_0 TaxID=2821099 RepID=UPI001ADD04DD|nr:SMP-30/gluconolactonase/LRE family protein [Ruegeria sp. R13_0]MBO9436655.1 SMP-30/gluconolactonase/LRE family protein [Ruegeria sp. R13_0]